MSATIARSAELTADEAGLLTRWRVHVAPLGEHDALALGATDTSLVRILDAAPDVVAFVYGSTAIIAPRTSPSPGVGGCFHCLQRRWQLLRLEDERNVLEMQSGLRRPYENPYLAGPVSHLVSSVIDAVVGEGGHWPVSDGGLTYVFEIRMDTGSVTPYPLIADADCPLCDLREADTPDAAVVAMRPRPKKSPGSPRVTDIHDYPLDTSTFANPVCGMLGRMAGRAFDSATTAAVTGFTRIRGDFHLHEFFWSGHANSFADSELLGILEGLERHAGLRERRIRPAVVDSYANLKDAALDPRSVGLYPDTFYEHIGGRFTPFRDDLRIPWVWGYSLRDAKPILVPHAFVYYLVTDFRTNFLAECSNGCATGGCREEAILYGLLELIERDAFLNAWYGKASLPEIDATTCRSPRTRLMIDRLSLLGYQVRLFDNRIDLPFPCVTGVAVRHDGGNGTLCFAAGAAFDPEDAISGALCEIASYVPGFSDRVDSNIDLIRAMQQDYTQVKELKHHALLFGVPEMAHHADFLLRSGRAPRSMTDLYGEWEAARPRSNDLTDDLRSIVNALVSRGFDVITADQTSPEQRAVGLTTVATIVPGLIPIDFGWTMQRALSARRLRTAPVSAGWRSTELDVSELNLHPHPFP